MLGFITWDVTPDILRLGPLVIRWYSLMFVIGFFAGYKIVARMFRHEGAPEKWLSVLLCYLIIGTAVGARLGHVFFYAWDYYSAHPADIIKIWEGGLASHGGTIGNIIGLLLFSWLVSKKSPSWVFDKVVVPVALVAGLIRLGNLMNSEIYGDYTQMPWGFIFVRNGETMASHPTQIYEALAYFALFAVLMWMYWKRNAEERPWLITGVFFIWVFGARFIIEYIKNVQERWEIQMIADYGINMGQALSIPFILLGVALVIIAMVRPRQHWAFPDRYSDADETPAKKSGRK